MNQAGGDCSRAENGDGASKTTTWASGSTFVGMPELEAAR